MFESRVELEFDIVIRLVEIGFKIECRFTLATEHRYVYHVSASCIL